MLNDFSLKNRSKPSKPIDTVKTVLNQKTGLNELQRFCGLGLKPVMKTD